MTGIAFTIGNITVGWYGILISTGILAAAGISLLQVKRYGESPDNVLNLLLFIIPMGLIGARLYHVIDRWDYYMQNPALIIGGQGLGIFGAIFGGIIGLVLFTRWKKLSALRWLDIVAPGLILAQAIGRWGNYFNQELYGYPSQLPWAIAIDPSNRLPGFEGYTHFHPLFLYESLWNLLGFCILMAASRKFTGFLRKGDIFFIYCIHYGIGRFFLEGMKPDVWVLGGIPTARWITGAAVILMVCIVVIRHRKQHREVI